MWKLPGYNLPASGRCEDREEVTGAEVTGSGAVYCGRVTGRTDRQYNAPGVPGEYIWGFGRDENSYRDKKS